MKVHPRRTAQILILIVALGWGTWASKLSAAIVIPTNLNGADAEVRESDINPCTDPLVCVPGTPLGTNRGASTELATRLKDSTANSGDRSSSIYLKFDITGVTQQDLDSFPARLRLHVRNSNQIQQGRTVNTPPNSMDPVTMTFNVYGLNNFALGNWDESTITHYNAPGITPDSPNTPLQDPGKYNFNSDLTLLGTFQFPTVPPQNSLAVGSPVDFTDPNGRLKNLLQTAKDTGQDHLTLVVAHGLDGFLPTAEELMMNPNSQTTPGNFLNFNYLFIPKEMNPLNVDTAWDADTTNPDNPLGGPFSAADNSLGQFSPKLMLVPEPGSLALLSLGIWIALALRRRK
jgi:hypothetical protein